jgi:hypothetical protein
MLTVKHIHTDGTERLMEAETVEVVRNDDRLADGIFLDREPVASGVAGLVQPQPRSFKHVIHFAECRASTDTTPRVYVMNRFGATVAQYNL